MLCRDAILGERRADGLAGRVVLPVALRHRPAHHRADPLPNPTRRHPLLVPDREQDPHHVRSSDPVYRPAPELRHPGVPKSRAPVCLGIAERQCLEPLGSDRDPRHQGLSVTRQALSKQLNGRTGISVAMAVRLSRAFGATPETRLGMQMAHDLWQARAAPTRSPWSATWRPDAPGRTRNPG